MKDLKKLLRAAIPIVLLVLAAIIVIRLITGAFRLVGGALNTILGIVVVLALVAIVIWMFSYAKKKK